MSITPAVTNSSSPVFDTQGLSLQQIINLISRLINQPEATSTVTSTPAATPSATPAPAARVGGIRRNLTVGSRGDDVKNLQRFLIAQGKGSSTEALAGAGDTGYFGALTRAALAEYQSSVGVAPSAGFFGPITRTKLQSLGQ